MKWYQYDIRSLADKDYAYWYYLMSKDKQQRVNRFRFENEKKRTIAGEMLARKAISEWCSIEPESIKFRIDAYGKPYTVDLNVEFNISHSGNMVVCAVDDNPVGIDVEKIRPIDLTITKYICTEEEQIYIFGYKPNNRDYSYIADEKILARFFEIWTRKEAYGKCMGRGLFEDSFNKDILTYTQTTLILQHSISITVLNNTVNI